MKERNNGRRDFLRNLTLGLGLITLSPSLSFSSCASSPQSKKAKKLGVALVGLGSYSSGQLAPALQETEHCYLAGIVTGTPAKENIWATKYNIPRKNIYNYENFDTIANNPEIDIVYVVLPVSMHKEFTIRAAKAGKHVICEKPMALNSGECKEMIEACKKANKMLSIGYRLHFEPHNQEMMRLGQKQVFGRVRNIDAANGFVYGGNPNSWRLKREMSGGGGLMDMGIYAIQGARYVTGEEPVSVLAREEKTKPELFREVDETIFWELEFPSGTISKGQSSYNANLNHLRAVAEQGFFELPSAYRYSGIEGRTSKGEMRFPQVNQQALQMDDFAQCILKGKATRVPGEEGLRDMKVIDAIYRSIKSGKKEKIV
ncbi:Gfo/Idh/MocA family protein [Pedobacter sp. SYSU D00535]|uniref:Gfo/Idh/MocA family protein n=1 Tax=Pedobacter sp. SYSU D00535 TaxID=2810308 RepID=UPI001A969D17|nr:Gfo/Idh/MocA family oxidoreductase [Pedobacter sp. SYSU D00535]